MQFEVTSSNDRSVNVSCHPATIPVQQSMGAEDGILRLPCRHQMKPSRIRNGEMAMSCSSSSMKMLCNREICHNQTVFPTFSVLSADIFACSSLRKPSALIIFRNQRTCG